LFHQKLERDAQKNHIDKKYIIEFEPEQSE